MNSRRLQTLLATLALAALAACGNKQRPVLIASDPAGARILLEGRDTGFVTPQSLDLSSEPSPLVVELELPGYRTARRLLKDGVQEQYVLYRDWTVYYNTWRFPLWLNWEDLFLQSIDIEGKQPARVFVRLARDAG